jgi:hypothetical protein
MREDTRLEVTTAAWDLRAWIYDKDQPKSLEVVGDAGGPSALFLQFQQGFYLEVTPTWVRPPHPVGPAVSCGDDAAGLLG